MFKWAHTLSQTNALTVELVLWSGAAGQAQYSPVAAVHVSDGVATQWSVDVEGKEHNNTQQSNEPGQGTAVLQPSWGHDGVIPEWFTHSDVPAERAQGALLKHTQYLCFYLP